MILFCPVENPRDRVPKNDQEAPCLKEIALKIQFLWRASKPLRVEFMPLSCSKRKVVAPNDFPKAVFHGTSDFQPH